VRECYEAFVIYQFFMYLVAYLEDEYGDISGGCWAVGMCFAVGGVACGVWRA